MAKKRKTLKPKAVYVKWCYEDYGDFGSWGVYGVGETRAEANRDSSMKGKVVRYIPAPVKVKVSK